MLFHTAQFAAFFAVFLAFYLPSRRSRWGVMVIVVFSSIFYGSWDWRFLPLLWFTIVMDYYVATVIARAPPGRRKPFLAISITANLAILGYFKYWNFLVQTTATQWAWIRGLSPGEIVLPLGISFYTFQSMSYVIDIYRGKQKPLRSLWDFAAFVTFFPHLVAGPIQRIQQLVPQILNPDRITFGRVAAGVSIFSLGLLRKCLGDTLAAFHDPIFQGLREARPADVGLAVLSFGLQIYLDFNGYSEMAIGIARVLGIDLMYNFDAPYLSTSIRDFWRRWHISLSQWLRDYLYISLGGSRLGYVRQMWNVLVTMTVCGLWHGAGWNFAVWGLLHGLYLALNNTFTRLCGDWVEARPARRKVMHLVGLILTYAAANYAWIFFRLRSFPESWVANRKLAAWLFHPGLPVAPRGVYVIFLLTLAMDLYTRFRGEMFSFELPLTPRRALAYGTVAGIFFTAGMLLSVGTATHQFIYFQF
jgi:D-alanyl-lipoteichoic acid acyltransferase DltB (MBOAT superfamily)